MATTTILVIGGGGREHALAWKLAQSSKVEKVIVYPGNGGTREGKICAAPDSFPGLSDFSVVADWCLSNHISLVAIGPEDPLANGISDVLTTKGIACFGPTKAASQIESSKQFAKRLMDKHEIPTARWRSFTSAVEAINYLQNECPFEKIVVKADGLAAGKGVIIADSRVQACQAVQEILQDKRFGESCSDCVVIEEFLEGFEVSCLCFTDGVNVHCMPPAQDHKRLLEGNTGPNTGGMGAYCPCPLVNPELFSKLESIMKKTVTALSDEGCPFIGVLYGGFMITDHGPKILEYNCRFGDPETQVLLPLMTSDLYEVIASCCNGTFADHRPTFDLEKSAVAVVLVSGGYPNKYQKALPIAGLGDVSDKVTVFHAGTKRDTTSGVLTSGGRVLAVVSCESTLQDAVDAAMVSAAKINFNGVFYRKDIAATAMNDPVSHANGLTYADAGVSIANGDDLVNSIKPLTAATLRPGCVGELGLFGSLFDLQQTSYKDPLLVSGTDGVGTKLLIANECVNHLTIGQDLVAMCVNDILCHGAEPLFFLDYFASGKLEVGVAKTVIEGVAKACKEAGCALTGGETAEMPGMYPPGKYDLAGFAVGAVERESYLPCIDDITAGDVLVGIPSSGVHSNGFSLVRAVVKKSGLKYSDKCPFNHRQTLGEALLTPTCLYVSPVLAALRSSAKVKAISHITGGGLQENLPRVLPDHLSVNLDASHWSMPPVFGWLKQTGIISDEEMCKTFNCGIGMVLITSQSEAEGLCQKVKGSIIGNVTERLAGSKHVQVANLSQAFNASWTGVQQQTRKMKVGVLISGSGTNLQALINSCQSWTSSAQIVKVISNVPEVRGLERAEKAGIPIQVISHKAYKSREEFDSVITDSLEAAGAELVCLAGFMRIVSGEFVKRWDGRLINVHPSLLPSFKGFDAHKQVLAAGVKVSGCTVHLVVEEVDSGAILEQETVPVLPGDTVESLQERVKTAEHVAFPRALQSLSSQILQDQETGEEAENES